MALRREKNFLDLVGGGQGLDQKHDFRRPHRYADRCFHERDDVREPRRFFMGFRLWNVKAEFRLKIGLLHGFTAFGGGFKEDSREIEQRRGDGPGGNDVPLIQMQATGPVEHDLSGGLDDRHLPRRIGVRQRPINRRRRVSMSGAHSLPVGRNRVLAIGHAAGILRITHRDEQLRVVGGAGDLIALVLRPLRYRQSPQTGRRLRGRKVIRRRARVSSFEETAALLKQETATGFEGAVQGKKKF